jgi:hypothetical protein
MLVQPTWEQNSKDGGRLIFRRYGDSNYLYQVWMPGQGAGRQFVRSRTEQERLRGLKSSSLAHVQLPTGPARLIRPVVLRHGAYDLRGGLPGDGDS